MRLEKLKDKTIALLRTKEFWIFAAFVILVSVIFIINSKHERYPDEFDNILGGKYLLQGKLIYKDWFTHHGPFSYVVAALVNFFSFNSFVLFRFFYAVFLLILTFGSYLYIKSSLKTVETKFYLFFIFFLGLASTYFWGQMLLADNLSAFLLTPVFALVFLKAINNLKFSTRDYIFVSIFTFLALMSALTYSYLAAGIYGFIFIYYFYQERRKANIVYLFKMLGIVIAPYALFFTYLVITGSLMTYFYDAIKFNRDYYIYYPGFEGKPPSNPIRYAVVMLQGFHNNFSSMMLTVRDFNFTFPFNITLGVVNTSLAIYLILKRKYLVVLFLVGVLIYANARTNPFTSAETDYQSAVYIMISLFNLCFIIPALYKEVNITTDFAKKVICTLLLVLVLIYSFFTFTFILRKFSYKAYDKYMGFAASIYDGPRIAPVMNRIVPEDSYSWIGPFAFEDLYYLDSKIPSTYQVLLPGMGKSEKIPAEILSDFEKNKPDVIYFDKDAFILGANPTEYGKFFMDYLSENYYLLDEIDGGAYEYTDSVDRSFLFEQKLYINKEKALDVIERLKSEGLIVNN